MDIVSIFWKYCKIRWERIVKEMYDFMCKECYFDHLYIDLWFQNGVKPETKIMPAHTNHDAFMMMVQEWMILKPPFKMDIQHTKVWGGGSKDM